MSPLQKSEIVAMIKGKSINYVVKMWSNVVKRGHLDKPPKTSALDKIALCIGISFPEQIRCL